MAVRVEEARYANVVVLDLVGAIDQEASPSLEAHLLKLVPNRPGGVVICLGKVPYVSSAGLRTLMIAAKEYGKENVKLALAGMSPCVREVFQISRFDKVLRIFETPNEAVGWVSPEAARTFAGHPSS